jgi:hypothetical protein
MPGTNRYRIFAIFLAVIMSACTGGGASTPSQSAVQDSALSASASVDAALSNKTALAALDSAPSVATPSRAITRHVATIHPDAKAPPFLINFVTAGPDVGGVPCISCVNSASTPANIGLSAPENYVETGAVWQYAMSFTDITFKGNCKLAWSIAAGKKVIDSFSTKTSAKAGTFKMFGFDRNRPSYSGSAVLMGKVTCGPTSQTTQTTLYFQ